jgi:hypothetical protein
MYISHHIASIPNSDVDDEEDDEHAKLYIRVDIIRTLVDLVVDYFIGLKEMK